MCVIPVRMAEVSTCDITICVGQKVKKGEQIGMFHFGGSTHCFSDQKLIWFGICMGRKIKLC
jgi:phosphatidylserine decarboxylase